MNRMGYIGEVKSMISELVQYRISPEQLVDLTEDKNNLTGTFCKTARRGNHVSRFL